MASLDERYRANLELCETAELLEGVRGVIGNTEYLKLYEYVHADEPANILADLKRGLGLIKRCSTVLVRPHRIAGMVADLHAMVLAARGGTGEDARRHTQQQPQQPRQHKGEGAAEDQDDDENDDDDDNDDDEAGTAPTIHDNGLGYQDGVIKGSVENGEQEEEGEGNNSRDDSEYAGAAAGAAAASKRKRGEAQQRQQAELRSSRGSVKQRRGAGTARRDDRSADDEDGGGDGGDDEDEDKAKGRRHASRRESPGKRAVRMPERDEDESDGRDRDGGDSSGTDHGGGAAGSSEKASDGGLSSGSDDYGCGRGRAGGFGGGAADDVDFGGGDISDNDDGDFHDFESHANRRAAAGRVGGAAGAGREALETAVDKGGEGQRGNAQSESTTISSSRTNGGDSSRSGSSNSVKNIDEVIAVVDDNKGRGQLFDGTKWRPPRQREGVVMNSTDGHNGELAYLCSSVENLKSGRPEPFPPLESSEGDNEHGLNPTDYVAMKRLYARLKVVVRIQLLDPDTKRPFYNDFLHADDSEIAAAIKEDGAGAIISVEMYKRAAQEVRSRQAGKQAAGGATRTRAKLSTGRG